MNQQIYEEACDWFVRMRDGENDPGAHGRLMDWFKRSPEHVSAYLDVAAIWRESRSVQVDSQLDVDTRIALARADNDVAELQPRPRISPPGFSPRRRRLFVAAAAGVVAVGAASLLAYTHGRAPDYVTQVGELRSIVLSDGSTVELNSKSRVEIRFTDHERRIELVQGQALFHVAKDPARPFVVDTAGASVRALGTVFDVYLKSSGSVVTVLEGAVAVLADPATAPTVLYAGKQVTVKHGAAAQPQPANIAVATAWTHRQLIFEFTPLAEAAEEFNRYNARKLVVTDPELRAFKVSAIFESTDPAALVEFLRGMPDVRVTEAEDAILVTRR